ncbi:MAG: hypothetical protein M1434_12315 [Chloroflexi bacterium]|nr:hypothetical protein [Chloroflexota bacterium]MCL5275507.1 hypothetical protein [Chloroflexota bacterium]
MEIWQGMLVLARLGDIPLLVKITEKHGGWDYYRQASVMITVAAEEDSSIYEEAVSGLKKLASSTHGDRSWHEVAGYILDEFLKRR